MTRFRADQLAGCRVLVTAQRRSAELGAALERRGAEVVNAPVLSVVPHTDDEQLLAATVSLVQDPPDVVVVTTGVGLRGWIEAADAVGLAGDLHRVLERARIVVRGPKARGAVQAAGLVADWVADSEVSAEIIEMLLAEGVAGLRIAVQHHGAGSDGLDDALTVAGAEVVPLVVYRWGPPPDPEAVRRGIRLVAAREVDCVVFTAAPATASFLSAAQEMGLRDEVLAACGDPAGVLAAAVGTTTAAPLVAAGVNPLIPDRFRLGALVRAVVAELMQRASAPIETPAGTLRMLRTAAVLDGAVVPLSPTSLLLLQTLAAADGGVVGRETLDRVLGSTDRHGTDVAVARLRESLPGKEIISTVIRRGYRLNRLDGQSPEQ